MSPEANATMMPMENWRDKAACKGLDPDIFFPLTDAEAGLAKLVCSSCPVRSDCLESAIANGHKQGIQGGLTENERHNLIRRRRAAARRVIAATV